MSHSYYFVLFCSNFSHFIIFAVRVDLTKPEPGDVIDGNDVDFTDLQFSSSQSNVQLQWKNFFDPESGIREYAARVWRQK